MSEAPEVSGPVMAAVARSTAGLPHTQKQQMLMECMDLVMVPFPLQHCYCDMRVCGRVVPLLDPVFKCVEMSLFNPQQEIHWQLRSSPALAFLKVAIR